jgi:hypothetical protein
MKNDMVVVLQRLHQARLPASRRRQDEMSDRADSDIRRKG